MSSVMVMHLDVLILSPHIVKASASPPPPPRRPYSSLVVVMEDVGVGWRGGWRGERPGCSFCNTIHATNMHATFTCSLYSYPQFGLPPSLTVTLSMRWVHAGIMIRPVKTLRIRKHWTHEVNKCMR